MNFALAEMPLPLRFLPETPMNDDDLMRFCVANDDLRVERTANGEIVVMTPAGNNTSRRNAYLTQVLGTCSDVDGRGYAFDSNTGFTLRTAPCWVRTQHGARPPDGMISASATRTGSHRSVRSSSSNLVPHPTVSLT